MHSQNFIDLIDDCKYGSIENIASLPFKKIVSLYKFNH